MTAVFSALKKVSDLENSVLIQKALHEFCLRGHYEKHLDRVRRIITKRMAAAFRALKRDMPEGTSWSEPGGGFGIWVRFPHGVRSAKVNEKAAERGVLVSPGTLFDSSGEDPGAVRLSISRIDEPAIEDGIRILGEIVKEEAAAPRKTKPVITETPQHL